MMTTTIQPSEVIVSDIEANGLLYEVSIMHCGVNINPFELKEYRYGPESVGEYLEQVSAHRCVAGHNYKGYDLLALRKLYGFEYDGFAFDTLVLSRLINPERKAHSLEYWGNFFKFPKDSFGKTADWSKFSPEMLLYCAQDVRVNAVLFLYFVNKLKWGDWFGVDEKECKRLADAIKAGDLEIIK